MQKIKLNASYVLQKVEKGRIEAREVKRVTLAEARKLLGA